MEQSRSPNFIVVTNAGEKLPRRIAYQFEMIRAVFRPFFHVQGSATDPQVIIIAAKNETTFQPLLPESYQRNGLLHLAGLYMAGPERNYMAIWLDVTLNREADQPFETVYHECVHYLMRRSISRLPLWLGKPRSDLLVNRPTTHSELGDPPQGSRDGSKQGADPCGLKSGPFCAPQVRGEIMSAIPPGQVVRGDPAPAETECPHILKVRGGAPKQTRQIR